MRSRIVEVGSDPSQPLQFMHFLFSNPITTSLAILFVVGYIVDRQLKPRPLDTRELLLMPIIMFYFAANALWGSAYTTPLVIEIVISVIIGVYFGYKSLAGIKLYADKVHGEAVIEGTWGYLKWYGLSIVARVVLIGVLYALYGGGVFSKATEAGFLVSTGVFVGVRSVDLYYRAEKLGIPLAQKRK